MYKEHLIKDKLLNQNYYVKKFPLYLRKSFGITDHLTPFYKVLSQLDVAGSELLGMINLWDVSLEDESGVLGWTNFKIVKWIADNFYNGSVSSALTSSDLKVLDLIGQIYRVKRNFKTANNSYSLNNQELLLLILFTSAKHSFDGTNEYAMNIYDKLRLKVEYQTTSSLTAQYWLDKEGNKGSNYYGTSPYIESMFTDGLLSFESLGVNVTNLLYTSGGGSTTAQYDSVINEHKYGYGSYAA